MRIELILKEVERLRKLMHETALYKGISHPEVLHISQQLDKKLNEYDATIYKKYDPLEVECNQIRKVSQRSIQQLRLISKTRASIREKIVSTQQ